MYTLRSNNCVLGLKSQFAIITCSHLKPVLRYLHGICDARSRLLFKLRSGTHDLNEELGRHRGREGKTEYSLCGNECENVSHVLWVFSI